MLKRRRESGRQLSLLMELQLLLLLTIPATEIVLAVFIDAPPNGLARIGLHAAVLAGVVASLLTCWAVTDRRARARRNSD